MQIDLKIRIWSKVKEHQFFGALHSVHDDREALFPSEIFFVAKSSG